MSLNPDSRLEAVRARAALMGFQIRERTGPDGHVYFVVNRLDVPGRGALRQGVVRSVEASLVAAERWSIACHIALCRSDVALPSSNATAADALEVLLDHLAGGRTAG